MENEIAAIITSKKKSDAKIKDILDLINERFTERRVQLKPKARFLGIEEVPEGLKLPPQAKIILDVLPTEGEGLTFAEWVEKVEGKIKTNQPVQRVVMFYKTKLNSDKLLVVK